MSAGRCAVDPSIGGEAHLAVAVQRANGCQAGLVSLSASRPGDPGGSRFEIYIRDDEADVAMPVGTWQLDGLVDFESTVTTTVDLQPGQRCTVTVTVVSHLCDRVETW